MFNGRNIILFIIQNRFHNITDDKEREALTTYLSTINLSTDNGTESAISAIFGKFLLERDDWALYVLAEKLLPPTLPVASFYGDTDWMLRSYKFEGGAKRKRDESLIPLPNSTDRPTASPVYIVEGSGHHVYLDNAKGLAESMTQFLGETVLAGEGGGEKDGKEKPNSEAEPTRI